MRRMKYLTPKEGIWHVWITVPTRLRKAVGQAKLVRSLRTRDQKEAERLAGPVIGEFLDTIDRAERGELFWIKRNMRDYMTRLIAPIIREGTTYHMDGSIDDPNKRGQLVEFFDDPIQFHETVDAFCKQHGIHKRDRDDFLSYLLREKRNLYPAQHAFVPHPREAPTVPVAVPVEITASGTTLSVFRDAHMQAKRITGNMATEYKRAFAILQRITGDCDLRAITTPHIREFRDTLLAYPVGLKLTRQADKLTPKEVRDHTWERTLNPATVGKYLSFVRTAFKFALNDGLIDKNPADQVQILVQPETAVYRDKRDYKPGELQTLFSSPLFHSCQSERYPHKPGNYQIRDHRYWLPWVGLYVPSRMGELTQLTRDDLRQDDGVWYLAITEDDGKSVKTERSVRNIPLHWHLIKLGFLDYARSQKGRLFPEGDDGKHLAKMYTKAYGRYTDKIGLIDPDTSYHSLRHSWITEARHAGIKSDVWKQLSAHRDQGDVGDDYGDKTTEAMEIRVKRRMSVLKEYVDLIRYEGITPKR